MGLITQLTGGPFDGLEQRVAVSVIQHRFDDDRPREFEDSRIAAIVAAVPAAAKSLDDATR